MFVPFALDLASITIQPSNNAHSKISLSYKYLQYQQIARSGMGKLRTYVAH